MPNAEWIELIPLQAATAMVVSFIVYDYVCRIMSLKKTKK